jgi:CheY-like chemotaxis protein
VESSTGKIVVESAPGAGARFEVFLPIIEAVPTLEAMEPTELILGGDERILVIDDEENVVLMEKVMLEKQGYRVTPRTSSIEGLEAFKANPDMFDLVITDTTMPNMSGDQLAKKILQIRPDIPILVCSGFSENMNDETAKAKGLSGFLAKPIVRSELCKMVRKALDNRSCRNVPPTPWSRGLKLT